MKTLQELLNEKLEDSLVAGKYKLGKSGPSISLSVKSVGKTATKEAVEKLKEKGFTDLKMYKPDKNLIYFISDNKVVAKIFDGVGSGKALMAFHTHD